MQQGHAPGAATRGPAYSGVVAAIEPRRALGAIRRVFQGKLRLWHSQSASIRGDEPQDAIAAINAREVAHAADPQGTPHANLILGFVVLPARRIFLLGFAAKGRP